MMIKPPGLRPDERSGERVEWTLLKHHVMRPGTLKYSRARSVPAVIHVGFPRVNCEYEFQPPVDVVGPETEGDERLDDDIPQRSGGAARTSRHIAPTLDDADRALRKRLTADRLYLPFASGVETRLMRLLPQQHVNGARTAV